MSKPTRKIALITGGNRGLGRSMVESLAASGVDSVFTYHSHESEAEAVVESLATTGRTVRALQLDTTNASSFPGFADSLRTTLQHGWGRDSFDILVNNAGFAGNGTLGTTTEETLNATFAVHYKGVYLLTQTLVTAPAGAAPLLADGGRILNVSTGLTRFVTEPYAVYASMKAAVEVVTRYWAAELGPRGITVNVVAPGPAVTDFGGGFDDAAQTYLGRLAALGRIGQPDDIGALVAALAGDSFRWVSGQRIEASGGFRL